MGVFWHWPTIREGSGEERLLRPTGRVPRDRWGPALLSHRADFVQSPSDRASNTHLAESE